MAYVTVAINQSTDPAAPDIAMDRIGGSDFQREKITWGAEGVANEVQDTDAGRLPVGGAAIGLTNEAAPGTDTAAAGLNGRLQRIAQRLTSLIALLPTALTAFGALKTGPAEGTATVTVTAGQTVSAEVDTAGMRNLGLIVPSTFDGTTITFQVSNVAGGTFVALYDMTNTQVSMTIAVSRAYDLPGELLPWRFLKIVCGTAQATENTDFILVYRS